MVREGRLGMICESQSLGGLEKDVLPFWRGARGRGLVLVCDFGRVGEEVGAVGLLGFWDWKGKDRRVEREKEIGREGKVDVLDLSFVSF